MREYDVDIRKLNNLSIYQLREVGAKVGVRNPTAMRSDELKDCIRDVVTGKTKPYLKAKSGRPHREVISDAEWDDIVGFNNSYEFCSRDDMLSLCSTSSNIYPNDSTQVYQGYVMQIQGNLIFSIGLAEQVRLNRYAIIPKNNSMYKLLKQGDLITATLATTDNELAYPNVAEIKSINGRTKFNKTAKSSSSTRQIDKNELPQFAYKYPQLNFLNSELPVKIGQRALFIGEDNTSGQDFLANSLAKDLSQNYSVVYLSCNKMPEDKMTFNDNVDYFFSTFDISPRNLVFSFEVAFERAKNLSNRGHTIFIVDNITDIMSAYLNLFRASKQLDTAGNLDEILQQLKIMFASSGINNNGSLTLFTFASVPSETHLADYMHQLDSLANCHYVLDKSAFLDGADEFLVKNECKINKPRRILVD